MGGGAHSGSRLAKYCSEKNFATSFQSFNTCYKVGGNEKMIERKLKLKLITHKITKKVLLKSSFKDFPASNKTYSE